jgi:O-antigen ligase
MTHRNALTRAYAEPGTANVADPTSASAAHPTAVEPAAPSTSVGSWPFVLVLAYLFVDYGRPQNWLPGLGIIKPGMLTLGGGMLALLAHQKLPKDRLTKYLLAILALMVVLVPFAVNQHKAFDQTWMFVLFVFGALIPIVLFVDTFDRIRLLVRFWVWLHVSLAIYAITHSGLGIGSFLTDENDFALAMDVALPYAVALIVLERTLLYRLLAIVASLCILIAIAATLSRGGFIGMACVGFFIWAQSRRKVLSLAAIVAFSGLLYLAAPAKYWSEVDTISTADQQGDTGYQRLYSWGIGWRMFLDNPVFGVGPNNYPVRAAEYETDVSDEIGYHMWGRAAHSLYFTLLPELGSTGTLLFAGMLFHGIRVRRRLRRELKPVLDQHSVGSEEFERARWLHRIAACMDASLAGYLSAGAFISVLYYPHVWVLTAFTASLVNIGSIEAAREGSTPTPPQTDTKPSLRGRYNPPSVRSLPNVARAGAR